MLLCLSSNHANASFSLLEKLSIGAPGAAVELVEASETVRGAVVLATCNRFEAYLDVEDAADAAVASTVAAISSASGLEARELLDSLAVHHGDEVARHLFAVTSGLESVVIGEDEISGQVQRALASARESGTSSPELERLFQRATHTSRGVRTKTAIGGVERSLVRLALELASSRLTDWATTSVLVVGTGRYAATSVAAVRALGATDIRVYSRSGRGPAFATKYGLRAETELAAALDADVILTCSGTGVITAADVVGDRQRVVIDLGLPRNVDRSVDGLPGVVLLDLEAIRLHAPLIEAHTEAHSLVREAAADFAADRAAEPAVVALREHILALVEAEIERARARGAGDETESALRHLAGVLLHTPSVRARELAADGRLDEVTAALAALYGVRPAAVSDDSAAEIA